MPFPEAMHAYRDELRTIVAGDLAAKHPDRVVATMTKSSGSKRVFIDWSQNNPANNHHALLPARQKTCRTRRPGHLGRGRSGLTERFLFTETMARIQEFGDLLAQ